jgi:Glyoxalase-like domain
MVPFPGSRISVSTRSTPDLLAAGATLLRLGDAEIHWDVLADPEGNEFCVFA